MLLLMVITAVPYAADKIPHVENGVLEGNGWQEVSLEPHFPPHAICTFKKKSVCVSPPLVREDVEVETWAQQAHETRRESAPDPLESFSERELSVKIYVDSDHRRFDEEIMDLFDHALVYQRQQGGLPLLIEAFCDDRETTAYSFILARKWGERVKEYLHYLALSPQRIDVVNYGVEQLLCATGERVCRTEKTQIHAAFRFLALKPRLGCLLRINVVGKREHLTHQEPHSLFLQKIHVASAGTHQLQP